MCMLSRKLCITDIGNACICLCLLICFCKFGRFRQFFSPLLSLLLSLLFASTTLYKNRYYRHSFFKLNYHALQTKLLQKYMLLQYTTYIKNEMLNESFTIAEDSIDSALSTTFLYNTKQVNGH